eukprot:2852978-Pleurochrysis_carterae.AAC.1
MRLARICLLLLPCRGYLVESSKCVEWAAGGGPVRAGQQLASYVNGWTCSAWAMGGYPSHLACTCPAPQQHYVLFRASPLWVPTDLIGEDMCLYWPLVSCRSLSPTLAGTRQRELFVMNEQGVTFVMRATVRGAFKVCRWRVSAASALLLLCSRVSGLLPTGSKGGAMLSKGLPGLKVCCTRFVEGAVARAVGGNMIRMCCKRSSVA